MDEGFDVEVVRGLTSAGIYIRRAAVPAEEGADTDWKEHKPGPAPVDENKLDFNGIHIPYTVASPAGRVEATVIRAIEAARTTIDIAMFSFYARPIAEALLRAKSRGVNVRLALDAGQAKLMKLDEWFAYHGFDVRLVAGPNDDGNVMFEKQHNKFMIVDGRLLETGSFNYTPNAQNNSFETANFFLDDPIVAGYRAFFEVMFDHGWEPRKPKEEPVLKTEDFFDQLAKTVGASPDAD